MNESRSRASSLAYSAGVLAILVIGATLLVSSSVQDSQTQDESVHLVSGYSYWKTGDFRLSPEHPPLSRLIASLPLLWLEPNFAPSPQEWQDADPWPLGKSFLYANVISADSIMLAARIPVMLMYVILGLSLTWWVARKAGRAAGFVALAMFAFEPTVLAHSRYVTTDIPVTLFIWLACISWYSYLERGGNWPLVRTGVLTGLAFATKFSALFLPFVFVLTCSKASKPSWRKIPILLGIALVMAICTYGFDTRSIAEDATVHQSKAMTSENRLVRSAMHLPIPGYYFIRGIQMLARDQIGGHQTYFMGTLSRRGTWGYFPTALLLKSSLAWLALVFLAAVLAIIQKKKPKVILLAAPALVYFGFSVASSFNIGIRHLLPIYPFLCAFAAIVLFAISQRTLVKVSASILVTLFLAESASAYPNYLSFFNRAAGGPEYGHHYLLDSNLDWGQDLKRLKQYVAKHDIQRICLSYFGTADPDFYGIHYQPLPQLKSAKDLDNLNCVVAVSLQYLYATEGLPFEALQGKTPTDRVGASIFIYDLRRQSPQVVAER